MLGIDALGQSALAQFPEFASAPIPIPVLPPQPVLSRKRIVNGWYTDSKGGIYYYYSDEDGLPGPRPPTTV